MSQPNRITGKTKLSEIMSIPGAIEVLAKYSLPCLHCPMASFEMSELEVGQVTEMYRIDLDGLLKELNGVLEKKRDK